jgi:hypothetical protein
MKWRCREGMKKGRGRWGPEGIKRRR